MKRSSEGPQGFQNRLLPIGRRPSGMVESLELRDVVSGMKRELHCLLRENIRLELSDTSDAGYRVKALRRDIEDLIRHLVLDARDAMPAGGELCILTSKVALDAEYTRTHSEVPQGNYAMLAIRDTGDGSNAESLKALKSEAVIRKGRSLGLTACYDVCAGFPASLLGGAGIRTMVPATLHFVCATKSSLSCSMCSRATRWLIADSVSEQRRVSSVLAPCDPSSKKRGEPE